MELPDKYKWLETLGPLPKLLAAGLQYLGVKEVPGATSNPVILEMAKGLGVDKIYTNDDQSWCAVFINHLIRITGKPIDLHPHDLYDLLRARQTATKFSLIAKDEAILADVVQLSRDGGGHVCLFIAKTLNGFIGFGGNQGNKVGFAEFDYGRIVAVKRFYATAPPASAKRYSMDSTGKLSTNEA